jgi:hypothetical protein
MSLDRVWFLMAGVAVLGGAVGCSNAGAISAPGDSIAGSWSSWPPGAVVNPAGPAGLLLSQSGDSLTGMYTWTTFTSPVVGSYVRPNVTLVVGVDTLTGVVKTATEMVVGGATWYKQ